jgi:hypothetical protein
MRTNTDNAFDPEKFDLSVTGPSLRGHIVNEHLDPAVLALVGPPKQDINLARHLKFPLDWVESQIADKLAMSDSELSRQIANANFQFAYSVEQYKEDLRQTLAYIRQTSPVDL